MIGSLTHLIRGAAIRAILGGQEAINPARLALFSDWAETLPPRPLPRTVTPVPGEYYLDYIFRLADANHLEFLELTEALDDAAARTIHSALRAGAWTQGQRQRLRQLDPGTWPQAAPRAGPGRQDNLSGELVIEIAIYPDTVRLAAHNLQVHDTSYREAS